MQTSTVVSHPPPPIFLQFKMEPKIHYSEDDCPVTAPDSFPKDVDLQFEIEMLDFFKAKVSLMWLEYEMLYIFQNLDAKDVLAYFQLLFTFYF